MEKVMQSFTDEQKEIKEYYLCDVLQYGKRFPMGTWIYFDVVDYNAAAIVTKAMIEDVLKWSEEELLKKLSQKTFYDNRLRGMLKIFDCSPYAAINNAYPDKYKPWQFANVPNSYWTKETAAEATRWLIEEKLKWSEEELLKKLGKKTFYDNGLKGMLTNVFDGSSYAAINNAYPGKYKPWQFEHVTRSYWTKERAVEATIWLIEEKLKWSEEDVVKKLSQKIFYDNGLRGMLKAVFVNSSYAAINNAYPGKYVKSDFYGYRNKV